MEKYMVIILSNLKYMLPESNKIRFIIFELFYKCILNL